MGRHLQYVEDASSLRSQGWDYCDSLVKNVGQRGHGTDDGNSKNA